MSKALTISLGIAAVAFVLAGETREARADVAAPTLRVVVERTHAVALGRVVRLNKRTMEVQIVRWLVGRPAQAPKRLTLRAEFIGCIPRWSNKIRVGQQSLFLLSRSGTSGARWFAAAELPVAGKYTYYHHQPVPGAAMAKHRVQGVSIQASRLLRKTLVQAVKGHLRCRLPGACSKAVRRKLRKRSRLHAYLIKR